VVTKCKDCGDILGSNSFCSRCKIVGSGGTEEEADVEAKRRQRRKVYSIGSEYFRCPTSGRVIQGDNHDDKVLCGCGRTNPALLVASPKSNEVHERVTVHVKRFLTPATVDEYLEQKDREQAIEDNKATEVNRPGREIHVIRVNDGGIKKWVVFDTETVTVVHGNGTQRETINKLLEKRPGEYKYVKYTGTMRASEMAMTVADFRMKLDEEKKKAVRG
jgi:hypothetical protein